MTPSDPPRWTDDRIDDQFAQVWREIDDLPNRMTRTEAHQESSLATVRRLEREFHEFRKEFRASRQGLSRTEKIALFAALGGFTSAMAAAAAVVIG